MPALPPSVLEPLWLQFAALLPVHQVHHPLGCHHRRIPEASRWGRWQLRPTAATTGSWRSL